MTHFSNNVTILSVKAACVEVKYGLPFNELYPGNIGVRIYYPQIQRSALAVPNPKQTRKQTKAPIATIKQTHPYRIPVGLLMLCPIAAVAESLVAVVVCGKLAQERLLSSVRPEHYWQYE